jgi:hypothetical protein
MVFKKSLSVLIEDFTFIIFLIWNGVLTYWVLQKGENIGLEIVQKVWRSAYKSSAFNGAQSEGKKLPRLIII